MPRLAVVVVSVAAGLWVVLTARAVLQPLVLSILIWFLLSASARGFARLRRGRGAEPGPAAHAGASLAIIGILVIVGLMVGDSLEPLGENMPEYAANLAAFLEPVARIFGISRIPNLSELSEGMDVASVAVNVIGSAAGLIGAVIVIIVYVVFIFAEAGRFGQKMAAFIPDPMRRAEIVSILVEIRWRIEIYLGVKCLIGVIQAVPTFVVLTAVGVASPIVWAVLIFLLSFIPTIGSLIGIALPAFLALIQFDTPTPFLVVLLTLAPMQILASNWLEPRLMGDSLNLSPLAVFLAIFGGGALWGVVGALVSVPALSIAVIAMSQAPATRPISILLSRDGYVIPLRQNDRTRCGS